MQSPVLFETSSNCGNSMPGSTAKGTLSSGSQIKIKSSVVCDTVKNNNKKVEINYT